MNDIQLCSMVFDFTYEFFMNESYYKDQYPIKRAFYYKEWSIILAFFEDYNSWIIIMIHKGMLKAILKSRNPCFKKFITVANVHFSSSSPKFDLTKDYYIILGVDVNSSAAEIKAKYY